MESATKVTFTTTKESTLTLVFNSVNSKTVNVDGAKYTLTDGVLTLGLEAGNHTITKSDSGNLFYAVVEYK